MNEKMYTYLTITDFDFSCNEITEAMELQPTDAWSMGDDWITKKFSLIPIKCQIDTLK